MKKFNRMFPKFMWENKLEKILIKFLKGNNEEELA